jgi:hypothetical protein
MCDISDLRSWLLGALAALGGAISCALFALFLDVPAYLWWIKSIGFTAALVLCIVAANLIDSAIGALNSYCSCVGPQCNAPCTSLKVALGIAFYLLAAEALLSLLSVAPFLAKGLALPLLAVLATIIGAVIVGLASVASLAACRPATAPASAPSGLTDSGGEPRVPRSPRASRMSYAPDHIRGLGDVIARVTSFFGVQPCEPCRRRAEALNAAVRFDK